MSKVDLNKKLSKGNKQNSDENLIDYKNKKRLNKQTEQEYIKPKKDLPKTKKNPLNKIKKPAITQETKTIDYAKFEEDLIQKEHDVEKTIELANKRKKAANKAFQIILIILSAYLAFLIYGAINTQYIYDEEGKVVPQTMSISDIKALDDYNKIYVQYSQARYIYENVLILDYRMGAGEEDPLLIAPEYETLLESINDLSIQVSALELPSEYTQTVSMLKQWIQNDVAIYCQSMSKAISQNNAESAEIALEYKTLMYNDFYTITQAVVTHGTQTNGADISDLTKWSPELYIQNEIGGVLNNE